MVNYNFPTVSLQVLSTSSFVLLPTKYRLHSGKPSAQDEIVFDEDKSSAERVLEVLNNVCLVAGCPVDKKAGYLAAFTKLLATTSASSTPTLDLGLRIKEILLW